MAQLEDGIKNHVDDSDYSIYTGMTGTIRYKFLKVHTYLPNEQFLKFAFDSI